MKLMKIKLDAAILIQYSIVVVKVLLIAFFGWILALLGKKVVEKIIGRVKISKNYEEFPRSVGNFVYYSIILLATVAILEVLNLKYVAEPFIDLFKKILSYIPNLIGAIVILVIGTLFANVAREFVKSAFEASGIKKLGSKYGIKDIGKIAGITVYSLVILLVAISALNALQIEAITDPAVKMLTSILNAIPNVVAALLIFTIIFLVGRAVADIISNLVNELNLDKLADEIGISSEKFKFNELIKNLFLTFVVLLGLDQAFHYLHATALYQIFNKFTVAFFKFVVAGIILFTGIYLGNIFEKRTENNVIKKFLKYTFIVISVLIALPYVGISPKIVESVVFSISIGLGIAIALAFGLGGKEIVAEFLKKLTDSKKDEKSKNEKIKEEE